ncbi:MAG: Rossmann-like domain-containing protein [Candidatus Helarchaeota archaeon]
MPKIIDRLIKTLELKSSGLEIPRIKTVSIGYIFIFIELENGFSGIAFHKISSSGHLHLKEAGKFNTKSIIELINFARKEEGIYKSIGIAAINALSQFILEKNKYNLRFDIDIISYMNFQESDKCGMVGNIEPIVNQIHNKVRKLVIIEDNVRRWKVPENVEIFQDSSHLGNINKLILSGSSILFNDFDNILNRYKNIEKIAIIGPSMGAIPEPFFENGVSVIGGIKILNPQLLHQRVMEGGGMPNFKGCYRKYLIINE